MFKILIINGGGVKLLYTLYLMQMIENIYGKQISDHFDMIIGTSSGSLVAAGIGLWGKQALPKLIHFYQNDAIKCFNNGLHIKNIGSLLTKGYLYTNNQLVDTIGKHIGDGTLDVFNNHICIPSYNLETSSGHLFKTSYDINNRSIIMIKDAVISSCVAPLYFPPHSTVCGTMVDCGLWLNKNLNNIAIKEFIDLNNYSKSKGNTPYTHCRILCMGNIDSENNSIRKLISNIARNTVRIIKNGSNDAFDTKTSHNQINFETKHISSKLFGFTEYIRLDQIEKIGYIKSMGIDHSNILKRMIANGQIDLSCFFIQKKSWNKI